MRDVFAPFESFLLQLNVDAVFETESVNSSGALYERGGAYVYNRLEKWMKLLDSEVKIQKCGATEQWIIVNTNQALANILRQSNKLPQYVVQVLENEED